MIKKFWYVFMVMVILSGLVQSPAKEMIVYSGDRNDPETLDPAQSWDETSSFHISAIFNTLITIDPKTQLAEPCLALSWNISDKGRIWNFKLRKGVKFHDKTPFNADAVVFTFQRQMDKNFPYRYYDFPMFKEIFASLTRVEKIAEDQVAFYLSEPFSPFLASLSVDCAAIVSPGAVKKKKERFRLEPVGTGPFVFHKWVRGKRLSVKANKNYWGGRPKIDRYITVIDPNLENLLNKFKMQKIDILHSYSISKMVSFQGLSWVSIVVSPSFSTSFMALNFKNRFLKKPGVRQALNYLWNHRILELIYQGHVIPLNSLLPKGISGYQESSIYQLSIARARDLLKKEGIKEPFSLNFLMLKDSELELEVATKYAVNLKKVGIDLEIIRVLASEYEDKIIKGEYDLTVSGWIADYPDPDSIVSPLFSDKLQAEGFANLSGGLDSEIDSLIAQGRIESDPIKRKQIYLKLNSLVLEKALFIPMYQDLNLIIVNNRIGRIKKNSFGRIDLFSLGDK